MKLSELWLREWINPDFARELLCEKLTMAGLEVEELRPVAEPFSGVVVANVLTVEKHPEADKLKLCQVDVGASKPLLIVCGATNVKPNMRVPAALDGAELVNDLKISRSVIRGIESNGMLCSARELGLTEQSEGLLELPSDAPIGKDFWDYFFLTDYVIDIAITPNRGDCLSVLGVAKELSALTKTPVKQPEIKTVIPAISDTVNVILKNPQECPRYVGRVIRQVKADAQTPVWMQERLRRSGQRCISPVVDVMNYVMLELGQPMHAFDLAKISGDISVRMANPQEEIALLDGQTVKLDANTLVIADDVNPLAIAGVMGGLDSAVTLLTKDIFLESAFFEAGNIGQTSRRYFLSSESSYRFERGIDPTLQKMAIERATQFLLEIVGGQPGPIIEVCHQDFLPQPSIITLTKEKLTTLLGLSIPEEQVTAIFQQLGFACEFHETHWQVTVPPRRSDIRLDVDLIEEVIRLYGYSQVPTHAPISTMQIHYRPENKTPFVLFRRALCDLGFQEVITYTFIDKKIQQLLDPAMQPKALLNPITTDMAVMRTSLWPGLVSTLLYNQNRQQSRARLFETGLRFIDSGNGLLQQKVLSGLVNGSVMPEQWGVKTREVDFFDLKGDLQQLFNLTHAADDFIFKPTTHPALHPGQAADIYRRGEWIGILGALHPSIIQSCDIIGKTFVFELLLDKLEEASLPHFTEISKFPEIRRDLAILVDQTIPSQAISDTIKEAAGELLKEINVFDVYQGKGIAPSHKSVALSLTLQHSCRTLVDEDVSMVIDRVITAIKKKFAAELRG